MKMTALTRGSVPIDKWWFFLMFAAGGISILLLDLLDQPKGYSMLLSASSIIAYAVAASLVPGLRARPDQVADNSYYLGLLFTLVSLSLALYRFASVELGTESILRNFGIAISSTIIGLAMRVLVSQFREDPADLEREARAALAGTVRKLRADLDQASAEMQRFTDSMRQALQETAVEATQASAEVIRKASAKFEKASDRISERMNGSADAFGAQADAMEAAVGRMATSLEALSGRIGAVHVDETLVQSALSEPLGSLVGSVQRLETRIDSEAERLEQGSKAIAELQGAVTLLGAAAQGLSETSTALARSGGEADGLRIRFDQLAGSVDMASRAASGFAGKVDQAASTDLIRASEALSALEGKLASVGIDASQHLLKVGEAAEAVRVSLTAMTQDFAGSGATIERVRAEMADLAGFVIKRLELQ